METEQNTETKIELALRQYNVADAWLDELTEKYGKHVVTPATRDADKILVKEIGDVRRAVESKRVFLKEESLKIGKAIDAEAKRLTARITEVEKHIAAQLEAMKAEEDAAKLWKKMQAIWPQREAELIALDFQWPVAEAELKKLQLMSDGDYYKLVNILRTRKLEAAEAENKKLREAQAAKEAEENKAKEIAAAQERARVEERERLEREQAQQAEMAKQEAARAEQAERERVAFEQAEAKEAQVKAEAEYARKADAEKVALWAAELLRIQPPQIENEKLQARVSAVLEFIEGLL